MNNLMLLPSISITKMKDCFSVYAYNGGKSIMNKSKRFATLDMINVFLLFISLVLLISVTFPTLNIFGYPHQVLSSTNPDLYVTISEQPLFHILFDDFYSFGLRISYVILLTFEILSIMLSLVFLVLLILKNKKTSNLLLVISSLSLLISSVLAIALFYTKPLILVFTLLSLLILIGIIVINFALILRKGYKNVRKENIV